MKELCLTLARARHKDILEDLGFDVTEVVSGLMAIEEYHPSRYDLMMLDLHMPDLDGMTVCQLLRDEEKELSWTRLPMIMVTSEQNELIKEGCLTAGATAVLSKPIDREQVSHVIKNCL